MVLKFKTYLNSREAVYDLRESWEFLFDLAQRAAGDDSSEFKERFFDELDRMDVALKHLEKKAY